MSWTTPVTWIPNDLVFAADMNAQVRDNLLVLATPIDTATGKLANLTSSSILSLAGLISKLDFNVTGGSNSGTGETDLATYSVAGGTLANAGDSVRIISWGTCTNSANAKTLKVYFGSLLHGFSGDIAVSLAQNWMIMAVVTRKTNTSQAIFSRIQCGSTGGNVSAWSTNTANGLSQTLSSANTAKTTGQGGASNEITCNGQTVEILRAP